MIADRRLYLDRSRTRLVAESSPEAAWLLNAKGQEIDPGEAKRLDLHVVDGSVRQGAPELPLEVVGDVLLEQAPERPQEERTESAETPADHVPEPIMPPQSRRSRGGRRST